MPGTDRDYMGKIRVAGVIPARWGSSRFPGKSLAQICGKPLIQWVLERAQQARLLDELIVATDDERICCVADALGARTVMTRSDHVSGTDRVAEAVDGLDCGVVVNIQGDEPLIDPCLIDRLAEVMLADESLPMATAAAPLHAPQAESPAICKVVVNGSGCALYFSRCPIPFVRDRDFRATETLYWRHIGLYVYRAAFLRALVQEPPSLLERAECLEQLRALHMGARIKVEFVEHDGIGVDTPEDVARAEELLRQNGLV